MRQFGHDCPTGCDCPDASTPKTAKYMRMLADRILRILSRSNPSKFNKVWTSRLHQSRSDHFKRAFEEGGYMLVCSTDSWVRAFLINLDNTPGQLSVFSAWIAPIGSAALEYHFTNQEQLTDLEAFLTQQLVLDDLSEI